MPRKTQETFKFRRMVWPYLLITHEDGGLEVEVQDAICPRCRARARVSSAGGGVLLQCFRCNISENYAGFESYDALKEHVASLILAERQA